MWGVSYLSLPIQVFVARSFTEADTLPGGRAEDTGGAAGLSCCLMPTVSLQAGMPELGLIRNTGMAPSLTSVGLSQDDLF